MNGHDPRESVHFLTWGKNLVKVVADQARADRVSIVFSHSGRLRGLVKKVSLWYGSPEREGEQQAFERQFFPMEAGHGSGNESNLVRFA